MSKWVELAALCEKAMGPDREIDCAMAILLGWEKQHAYGYGGFWLTPEKRMRVVPLWSDSLDAITALIDRELPGSMRSIRKHPDGEAVAQVWNSQVVGETPRQRCCASEALALCAAFCRAMNQADGKTPERKNALENGCGND
ncbi:MAG: hypothetical protein IOC54_16330 [Methylobacterium sp.]|nr:hypothetical protein [Methylobacterium sp.]